MIHIKYYRTVTTFDNNFTKFRKVNIDKGEYVL